MGEGSGSSGKTARGAGGATSLKTIRLLEGQSEETVAELEKLCRWHRYSEGELIFDRTDTASDVFFIVKGRCRVVGHAKSGQEIAFIDLDAGENFGELSAIDGQARSATLYALEDTELASVPGDAFIQFVHEHPKVATNLIDSFVRLIRSLNSRVVGLSSTSDEQRVYTEILHMAEPDPDDPSRWIVKFMPHHREIALWAGTTPETVAQAIGHLLETEVARRQYKTLQILDRHRLQEFIVET